LFSCLGSKQTQTINLSDVNRLNLRQTISSQTKLAADSPKS
jgi:hypothetical protein